ncbi:DUF4190 domain-containing protein [Solwaraspora sp. WMMD406]|uniref:DUF4190 domain-containing protein n=1 Tax=Solwaraspora sp. WMMD406 TaxID=3016095 RepID=UPI002415BB4E|nr:DUF4190 domain-containing protein [Solwaraspora sp. WMMD406]MDG4768126.1 DUF4190 domain-containing protein [Solwaraspora sp. WMMD406]
MTDPDADKDASPSTWAASGSTAGDGGSLPSGAGAGQPPAGYPPAGYPPAGYGGYPPSRHTNSMALASFIVALVSLFSCPLLGAVSIYLGRRARLEISGSGEQGDGLAQAGVIIGWCAVGLAVLSVLVMIAYFAFFFMVVGTTASAY